jgi:hypothetical protein
MQMQNIPCEANGLASPTTFGKHRLGQGFSYIGAQLMNIKSLLIGSAAALAAVSGAQAADAIVAAEPEPLEYVRVCDAFGAGFFYIPGSETCLKIGGYIRFQTNFGRDQSGTSDWDTFTRAQLDIDTKTDTEIGTVRGFISLRGNADAGTGGAVANSSNTGSGVAVNQAFIEFAGLRVGKFYSWWDDDLSGETDILGTNTLFNSIRYTYEAGNFSVGVSVDELEGTGASFGRFGNYSPLGIPSTVSVENDNNVGVTANVAATFGVATLNVLGSYDFDQEEGAVRAMLTADFGPGTLGLAGVYASGINAYYAVSEWSVAAEYAIKATDKLTIIPGAQYFGNVSDSYTVPGSTSADTISGYSGRTFVVANDWTSDDAWTAGVTVDYKITQGLAAKVTANYFKVDGGDDEVNGFVRLQRTF